MTIPTPGTNNFASTFNGDRFAGVGAGAGGWGFDIFRAASRATLSSRTNFCVQKDGEFEEQNAFMNKVATKSHRRRRRRRRRHDVVVVREEDSVHQTGDAR